MYKTSFTKEEIKHICNISELKEIQIDNFLTNFRYYKGLHGWLTKRKNENKNIPETQDEMQAILSEERPEFLLEIQKGMMKNIKRKLGYTSQYMKKQQQKQYEDFFKRRKRTHTY